MGDDRRYKPCHARPASLIGGSSSNPMFESVTHLRRTQRCVRPACAARAHGRGATHAMSVRGGACVRSTAEQLDPPPAGASTRGSAAMMGAASNITAMSMLQACTASQPPPLARTWPSANVKGTLSATVEHCSSRPSGLTLGQHSTEQHGTQRQGGMANTALTAAQRDHHHGQ